MVEEPRPSELSRRVDDLRDEFRSSMRGLNDRLDKMPTNDLLLAYLAKQDAAIKAGEDDVTDLRAGLAEIRRETVAAKRWAVGTAISGGALFIAALGLVRSFVG